MSENNTMCQYCGKSLKGLFRESGRKYCSRGTARNQTVKGLRVKIISVLRLRQKKYYSPLDRLDSLNGLKN